MRNSIILILLGIAITTACKKSRPIGENEYISFSYLQTSCADPWTNASTDSLTLVNVAKYLNTAGLYVASLNIKGESNPVICLACPCKTGKTIWVTTLNSEMMKNRYQELGFK